jgi:colanic acid biosynthesis glycosyl transferase WcaI
MFVLILSQYYPPEPITRLKDLVPYLKSQGHQVSVVTTFPSYPFGQLYEGYRLGWHKKCWEDSTEIVRVFAWPYRGMSGVRRFLSYGSFAATAFISDLLPRLLLHRRPDVLYIYHPPLTTGLVGAIYAALANVPFIYDVQDIWPDAIAAAGLLRPNSHLYRWLRRIEDFIYRHADQINVISSGMKNNLQQKGVPEHKLSVISNWGDPDIYKSQDVSEWREQLGWGDRFVVLIAGNMGLTHGLETVIEAAEKIGAKNRKILFAFLGSGAALPGLQATVLARQLNNVNFYPQVNPQEAMQYINAADVTLLHLKPDLGGEFSVPHRIFSYMLCGKPIIAAATGGTANLVEIFNCGWVCPPCNATRLADIIVAAQLNPEQGRQLGKNGLVAVNGEYGRNRLLQRIEDTLMAAANL